MSFYILLVVLTIIVCLLLAFFVLIQNPKGGGLDSNFGGVSSNTFGAQRTTDFLEKGTWFLAIALLAISLISGVVIQNNDRSVSSGLENVAPSSLPVEENSIEDFINNGGNDESQSVPSTEPTTEPETPN